MARWEGGAQERLQQAALGLFAERGFEGATVAEIAAAAGLTERTFFRYYADKREVLFRDQGAFEQAFVTGLRGAPGGTGPMAMIAAALEAGAVSHPQERRPWSRTRQEVVSAHGAFQERELLKLSALADTLTGALAERGVDPTTAALAAQSGVTVYRAAFAAWIADGEERPFAEVQREILGKLHALLGTPPA